jgi:hypothetical protein
MPPHFSISNILHLFNEKLNSFFIISRNRDQNFIKRVSDGGGLQKVAPREEKMASRAL